MPTQDTSGIKNKIIFILRKNGPSLPVHIAREIESNILFASAFLSELASEKRLKISYLKIGNSPLYYLPEQKFLLEKFSNHLKNKEKEAFTILKEKKFLKDSEQTPAIRVALREIKDFAIPFRKDEELIWRFYTVPEEEFEAGKKGIKPIIKRGEKELDIFDKPKKVIRKISRKKRPQKENKFFEEIKDFLTKRSLEMADIISFSKNEIIMKIKDDEKEKILIAYNKKRINENDIIKASKKASELGIPYIILSKGEPLKKVQGLLDALSNLSFIGKIK